MTAVRLTYLYRDGSNYKSWGEVVFSNPEEVPLQQIEHRLRRTFDSDSIFAAHQLRLPEVFLYRDGVVTEFDHCFHEFYTVSYTDEIPNDTYRRTIMDLIEEVEREANRGWSVFDPVSKASTYRNNR